MPDRRLQALLIASSLAASWLGMQLIHEMGHVLVGWATGGHVRQVVFHPLTLSRTDFAANPQPLWAAWGGPFLGALLPALAWAAAVAMQVRESYLLRFFAGFCLVANGVYLGVAPLLCAGDCATIVGLGAARLPMTLFGLIAVPSGFLLWHGEGRHFGFGAGGTVSKTDAFVAFAVAVMLSAIGLLAGPESRE